MCHLYKITWNILSKKFGNIGQMKRQIVYLFYFIDKQFDIFPKKYVLNRAVNINKIINFFQF